MRCSRSEQNNTQTTPSFLPMSKEMSEGRIDSVSAYNDFAGKMKTYSTCTMVFSKSQVIFCVIQSKYTMKCIFCQDV